MTNIIRKPWHKPGFWGIHHAPRGNVPTTTIIERKADARPESDTELNAAIDSQIKDWFK